METTQDYINASRIMLQDTKAGAYRYSDDMFKLALDLSFDEAYRIRPDLFVKVATPTVLASALTYVLPIPRGYQAAFLYFMCGHVQLSDQEDTTDTRASAFLAKFTAKLLVTAA